MEKQDDTGKHVIVVGGGLVGCETALHLAQKGKSVTVMDKLPEIAQDIIFMARFSLLQALAEKSIPTEASLELIEITDKGIIVKGKMGDMKEMSCDTVVFAVGLKADDVLYQELAEKYDEIYKIGDCIKARKFIDVTQEAYHVAMDI